MKERIDDVLKKDPFFEEFRRDKRDKPESKLDRLIREEKLKKMRNAKYVKIPQKGYRLSSDRLFEIMFNVV